MKYTWEADDIKNGVYGVVLKNGKIEKAGIVCVVSHVIASDPALGLVHYIGLVDVADGTHIYAQFNTISTTCSEVELAEKNNLGVAAEYFNRNEIIPANRLNISRHLLDVGNDAEFLDD